METNDAVVRWGILGPGSIAHRFASQLPHSQTGKLYAVASRDAAKAKAFADEFGAEVTYDSYEALLADPQVDAVYISTIHTNHHTLAAQAAAAGKHVLCEKPLAATHAWATAAVEAAYQHKVFLAEAYMYRFHPQTIRLAELVAEGAIGELFAIESSFSYNASGNKEHRGFDADLAGGGILDVGGYPVSMSRLLAGAAAGKPYLDPTGLRAVGQQTDDGVDEWTVATLTFPTGVTARVSTGVTINEPNNTVVYGSKGTLLVESPWVIDPTGPGKIVLTTADGQQTVIETDAGYQYALEADAVGLRGDALESPLMSWGDSLGTAKVLDEWRQALGNRYPFEEDDAPHEPIIRPQDQLPPTYQMPYGELPGVDKPVSRLVMGCDNQLAMAHASVVFDDFYARGGNTFDTGYIYGGGKIEPLLGRWIKNRGLRDKVVVIGKGAHTPHCDPESITRQLNETLERLQTDYLDLYLMHRDNLEYNVGDFIDVLDEHQRAGRIKAFGASNWTVARYDEANRYARENGKAGFVALSNHFGLARALDVPWAGCQHATDPQTQAWLRKEQIALFPWSSQARGFFAPGRSHPDDHSDPELVRCYYSPDNFERLRRAELLGQQRGVAATAIALAYVLAQPFPTFPLIGPRTVQETRTSTDALAITLTDDEREWLNLTTDTQPF